MEVRTILWPTDLSKNSLKATKHVVSLADKYQAKVVLLYVGVDLMSFFPAYGSYPSEGQLHHFQDWEVKHAKKRLESVCQKDLKACPNVQVRLVQGDAAAEILKAVKKEKANLVVLTTPAMRRWTRPAPRSAAWRKRSSGILRSRTTWSIPTGNNPDS